MAAKKKSEVSAEPVFYSSTSTPFDRRYAVYQTILNNRNYSPSGGHSITQPKDAAREALEVVRILEERETPAVELSGIGAQLKQLLHRERK